MKEYTDTFGNECVLVENEDGTIWSGLKSAWEEMQTQAELGGTL